MKPVGSNGSSSSSLLVVVVVVVAVVLCCSLFWLSVGRGRSDVTRHRGLSWARRWNMWWGWDCRSSTTRPQDVHSVMDFPVVVVAQRPCAAEQYEHFIFFCFSSVAFLFVFFSFIIRLLVISIHSSSQ
jgi:hypothetical protein